MKQPPREIAQLDRGAELIGHLPNGAEVWAATYSPPSSIERDIVLVYHRGLTRKATEADCQRIKPL